jgi:hypothetical protein
MNKYCFNLDDKIVYFLAFLRLKTFIIVVLLFFWLVASPVFAEVKINEFVPDSSQEWVEFYNSSPSAEYLKDYYLDDDLDFTEDAGSSPKKSLSNLDITNPNFPVINLNFSMLNNNGDWVVLFDKAGNVVDSYQYLANPGRDVSIGRFPDYSGGFFVLSYPTKGDANSVPLTPSPSPTSTSTPTSTPVKPTATFKINEARDKNDSVLTGAVKIYIDGSYTGNYAPETYIFCDGCKCGTNNVSCNFGSHTIKVEKTGYESWTKTLNLKAGNNYEETPVLALLSLTPTPTPKPSITPTPTPSPSPSLQPEAEILASSPSLAENLLPEIKVLGLGTEDIDKKEESSNSDSYFNIAGLFFIIAGLSFLSAASYAYFRSKKKGEIKSESQNSQDEETP